MVIYRLLLYFTVYNPKSVAFKSRIWMILVMESWLLSANDHPIWHASLFSAMIDSHMSLSTKFSALIIFESLLGSRRSSLSVGELYERSRKMIQNVLAVKWITHLWRHKHPHGGAVSFRVRHLLGTLRKEWFSNHIWPNSKWFQSQKIHEQGIHTRYSSN